MLGETSVNEITDHLNTKHTPIRTMAREKPQETYIRFLFIPNMHISLSLKPRSHGAAKSRDIQCQGSKKKMDVVLAIANVVE